VWVWILQKKSLGETGQKESRRERKRKRIEGKKKIHTPSIELIENYYMVIAGASNFFRFLAQILSSFELKNGRKFAKVALFFASYRW